jgi:hypothetical protein
MRYQHHHHLANQHVITKCQRNIIWSALGRILSHRLSYCPQFTREKIETEDTAHSWGKIRERRWNMQTLNPAMWTPESSLATHALPSIGWSQSFCGLLFCGGEVLGFELRASHLLGRHCRMHLSHSASAFLVLDILRWGLENYLPSLASNCNPPISAPGIAKITSMSHCSWLWGPSSTLCLLFVQGI